MVSLLAQALYLAFIHSLCVCAVAKSSKRKILLFRLDKCMVVSAMQILLLQE